VLGVESNFGGECLPNRPNATILANPGELGRNAIAIEAHFAINDLLAVDRSAAIAEVHLPPRAK
jgi:hypothetical protein